jgi:hypothetical protein
MRAVKGDTATALLEKAENAEAKAKRARNAQALRALQAAAETRDGDYVRAAREREKARREAEKAAKTRTPAPVEAEP